MLSFVLLIFSLTGCVSHPGERVKLTPEIRQEINKMSTDAAIQTITDYCKKRDTRRHQLWGGKFSVRYIETSRGLVMRPGGEKFSRYVATQNSGEDVVRVGAKLWIPHSQLVVTKTGIEEHETDEWWVWTETDDKRINHILGKMKPGSWVSLGRLYSSQPELIHQTTEINEYRYTDIIELRRDSNALWVYSRVRTKYYSTSFVVHLPDEIDLNPLIVAFIKLCPNIKI